MPSIEEASSIMNLRQQIIQDRAEALAGQLHIDIDGAFMRLVHSLVMGKSTHDFDPNDVVDGGQDKQMDLITIEEDDESTDLYVIQSKHTTSFSSNALIQLEFIPINLQVPRKPHASGVTV
jgi:non-homologous end joining protein Ku